MQKLQPPPPPQKKKVTPIFPTNPSLKVEVLSSPPPFWEFGRRGDGGIGGAGGGAHYE